MPKINDIQEVLSDDSIFPKEIAVPKEYYPEGIGPGSFDPQLLYSHALALNKSPISAVIGWEMKPWVLLLLMDYVDWDKMLEDINAR